MAVVIGVNGQLCGQASHIRLCLAHLAIGLENALPKESGL